MGAAVSEPTRTSLARRLPQFAGGAAVPGDFVISSLAGNAVRRFDCYSNDERALKRTGLGCNQCNLGAIDFADSSPFNRWEVLGGALADKYARLFQAART